jgi:hypothetical protein
MKFSEYLNSKSVQDFIQIHKDDNLANVALELSKHPDLPKNFILNQINGIQKVKHKLPFLENSTVVYPPKISIEQCSSQITAQYKASLVSGCNLLDLSMGFGIDSIFFTQKIPNITGVEPNSELTEIVKFNLKKLHLDKKIKVVNTTAEEYLTLNNQKFDWIYIDPSRRTSQREKVIDLLKYTPNVVELLPVLLKYSDNLLIKVSPFADLYYLRNLFGQYLEEIHIVAIKKECKEILLVINKNTKQLQVKTIHFIDDEQKEEFSFYWDDNQINNNSRKLTDKMPQDAFLYLPNVAILKAKGFNALTNVFNMTPVSDNTHLFISEQKIKNFPGECFAMLQEISPKQIKYDKIQVILKNYPLTHKQFEKKYKIKSGNFSDEVLFGFKDNKNKIKHYLTKRCN